MHNDMDLITRAKLATELDGDDPQTVTHSNRVELPCGSNRTRSITWRRTRYLGCGGFGPVYLQECEVVNVSWDDSDHAGDSDDHKMIGHLRAVKQVVKPTGPSSDRDELVRELRGLLFFNQPQFEYYFVRTFGWYESSSTLFIAMEYVSGGDMQSYLKEHGRLKPTDVELISKQMLRGLQFMHENEFVHRDMKPANLLIKSSPRDGGSWWIKIADFGTSKLAEKSRGLASTVCGTIGFMAPELFGFLAPRDRTSPQQLSSLERGTKIDIWAAGETIFRLLTGIASFGDDLSLLGAYVAGMDDFPDAVMNTLGFQNRDPATFQQARVFIRSLMRPSPHSRPTAKSALENITWSHGQNAYRSWVARLVHTGTLPEHTAPMLMVSDAGDRMVMITLGALYLWDTEKHSPIRAKQLLAIGKGHRTHASMSPDGRYVCVTQAGASMRPPLIYDAKSLALVAMPADKIDRSWAEEEIRMSAWSPDGATLVTACGGLLSEISVTARGWVSVNQFLATDESQLEITEPLSGIRALRFTQDGKRLIAAYETRLIIKDATDRIAWPTIEVYEYPCAPSLCSSVCISQYGVVACGTTTGKLWLWRDGCWMRRMFSTDQSIPPFGNVQFSRNGENVFYNFQDQALVHMVKVLPLDDVSHCAILPGRTDRLVGQTVTLGNDDKLGATAFGGSGGAGFVFWRLEESLVVA